MNKNQSKLVLAQIFRQMWSLFGDFHFILFYNGGCVCTFHLCLLSFFIIFLNKFVFANFFFALQILFGIYVVFEKNVFGSITATEQERNQFNDAEFFFSSYVCKSFVKYASIHTHTCEFFSSYYCKSTYSEPFLCRINSSIEGLK